MSLRRGSGLVRGTRYFVLWRQHARNGLGLPPGRFQGEAKARNKVEKRVTEPERLDGGKQGEGVKDMKEENKPSLCSSVQLA